MTSFRTKIAKKKEMTRKDLCVPFSECQSAVKIMFDIGTIFVVIRVNFPLKKKSVYISPLFSNKLAADNCVATPLLCT